LSRRVNVERVRFEEEGGVYPPAEGTLYYQALNARNNYILLQIRVRESMNAEEAERTLAYGLTLETDCTSVILSSTRYRFHYPSSTTMMFTPHHNITEKEQRAIIALDIYAEKI